MKKNIVSLLLSIAIISSIFVNVFATDDPCPHMPIINFTIIATK